MGLNGQAHDNAVNFRRNGQFSRRPLRQTPSIEASEVLPHHGFQGEGVNTHDFGFIKGKRWFCVIEICYQNKRLQV